MPKPIAAEPNAAHATNPKRPILRYHGGKWRLAHWVIAHLPPHRTYVEPFGGAASVLLRKPPSPCEVYNDLDGEIVNLFKVVRDRGAELRERLELTPYSRGEFELSYEEAEDPIEQARRTVVRSMMGLGTALTRRTASGALTRTGFRNVAPNASTSAVLDWHNYAQALPSLIERLRSVVFENRGAHKVMLAHDTPDTVHYVDPPYVVSTRSQAGAYRFEMKDDDHERLAHALHQLRGAVVLSGYPSPLYDGLYRGWRLVTRAAATFAARPRLEVLWLSPNVRLPSGVNLSGSTQPDSDVCAATREWTTS